MEKLKIETYPKDPSKVIRVYLIDNKNFLLSETGYEEEFFDEKTMIKCDEYERPTQLKPKWNKKSKKWTEGASKEELSAHFESIKSQLIESNKQEVSSISLSIASELEQSNWVNFPEDYEPEEIEEKKNQIREIRAKGREIREKISATQSLEELSELDLNIIPLPEPEELTE